MSFLAGRLASTEGAYFLQESKQTVLRHSLPPKIFQSSLENSNSSTLSSPSKWVLQSDPTNVGVVVSSDALNPLRAYVSLPQVTFGPKRRVLCFDDIVFNIDLNCLSCLAFSCWKKVFDCRNGPLGLFVQLGFFMAAQHRSPAPTKAGAKRRPAWWQLPSMESSVLPSTANDLRQDKYTPMNPEKLKAAAAGLSQIGTAFAVATAVVFGGGALIFSVAASKLEVHNTDDLRTKGKDLFQPRFETIREQLAPLRTWTEDMSKKWHLEREESVKDRPLIKELSRTLSSKTTT
ncbi:hypothetical protein F511_05483 [Dorcoceras hygrometricum]|uniref:Uncharacterized protein n=1 Tax=Dorcoceras hygrometricum TaxID=472368 RepID=A0A2Z7BD90_9LAMI|nr:hypothetical protein F511_05483 [Dorcoceras hygrometricum]